jgi:hypothetical protein
MASPLASVAFLVAIVLQFQAAAAADNIICALNRCATYVPSDPGTGGYWVCPDTFVPATNPFVQNTGVNDGDPYIDPATDQATCFHNMVVHAGGISADFTGQVCTIFQNTNQFLNPPNPVDFSDIDFYLPGSFFAIYDRLPPTQFQANPGCGPGPTSTTTATTTTTATSTETNTATTTATSTETDTTTATSTETDTATTTATSTETDTATTTATSTETDTATTTATSTETDTATTTATSTETDTTTTTSTESDTTTATSTKTDTGTTTATSTETDTSTTSLLAATITRLLSLTETDISTIYTCPRSAHRPAETVTLTVGSGSRPGVGKPATLTVTVASVSTTTITLSTTTVTVAATTITLAPLVNTVTATEAVCMSGDQSGSKGESASSWNASGNTGTYRAPVVTKGSGGYYNSATRSKVSGMLHTVVFVLAILLFVI